MQSNNNPSRLSDDELVAEVERLARCEREATAQLIVYLVELDERRLYLGAGFSSLFTCCTEVLKVSEHETYQRIAAARTSRRFPVLLRMLAEGSLNLTSVRLRAPHLNEDNQEELFAAASGKSRRELEELLARRSPQPEVASSIRKLPGPRPALEPSAMLMVVGSAAASAPDAGARPAGPADQCSGGAGPLGRTERNVDVVPRGFNGVQAKIPPDVYREGVGGR